jgi:hypothetical protein
MYLRFQDSEALPDLGHLRSVWVFRTLLLACQCSVTKLSLMYTATHTFSFGIQVKLMSLSNSLMSSFMTVGVCNIRS